jgi:hypothetical protein
VPVSPKAGFPALGHGVDEGARFVGAPDAGTGVPPSTIALVAAKHILEGVRADSLQSNRN